MKKKPDASHIRITDEDFDESYLMKILAVWVCSLQKQLLNLDNVFEIKMPSPLFLIESKILPNQKIFL
jgi:hypothetical protein